MHPNPIFRTKTDQENLNFARKRGFGALMINSDPVPLIAHVPFVVDPVRPLADLHLVRSNPIARAVSSPIPAIISVTGPDAYISPDWYEVPDQVPTWNYVAVNLRGTLVPLDRDELKNSLNTLSSHFENQLAPKAPWTMAKMTPEVLERMKRMILPFRFEIESLEGTWKLSQNKTDDVREKAAAAIETSGIGQETAEMARLMRREIPKS